MSKGSEYFIDERFITIKQVFDRMMKDKGLYIKVVMLRNKEWIEWHLGEKKKSQKLIKKQREQLKQTKAELHKKGNCSHKIKPKTERENWLDIKELIHKRKN